MSKNPAKGRIAQRKFSLTLHKTGQYCKRIAGKTYYFGSDKQKALQRYFKQAAYLYLSTGIRARSSYKATVDSLFRLYLARQEPRARAGEIKPRHRDSY